MNADIMWDVKGKEIPMWHQYFQKQNWSFLQSYLLLSHISKQNCHQIPANRLMLEWVYAVYTSYMRDRREHIKWHQTDFDVIRTST